MSHVNNDQGHNSLPKRGGEFHPIEKFYRESTAFVFVGRRDNPFLIAAEFGSRGGRLAEIMQQHGKHEHRSGRGGSRLPFGERGEGIDTVQSMGPNIPFWMPFGFLGHPFDSGEFRIVLPPGGLL